MTALRRDLRPSGEEGGRSVSGGAATRRIRRALVVAEFALAIVLLVGAGLLVRSWWHVRASIRDSGPSGSLRWSSPPRRASTSPRSGPTCTTACSNRFRRFPVWRAPASSAICSSATPGNRSSRPKATTERFPSACGSEETRSARISSKPSGRRCSEAASFRSGMGPMLRGLRSSTRRWLAARGPGAIQWAEDSSWARGIPTARGSPSSAWWATCGGRGWSANRSRRCSSRWRRILPGAWTFSYEPRRTTR